MMRWLVRFVILFLVVVLVLRWVLRALGLGPKPPREERAAQLKRDPICGMFVDPRVSLAEPGPGETLYFCSEPCRQEYRLRQRSLPVGTSG